jgi:hypothetical protein
MRSPTTSSTSEPFLFAIQVCLADLPERRRSKTLLGNRCTSRSLRATAGDCDHLRRDPTQEVAGSSPARSTSGASRRTRRADLLFACARQPLTTPRGWAPSHVRSRARDRALRSDDVRPGVGLDSHGRRRLLVAGASVGCPAGPRARVTSAGTLSILGVSPRGCCSYQRA